MVLSKEEKVKGQNLLVLCLPRLGELEPSMSPALQKLLGVRTLFLLVSFLSAP